MKQGYGSNVKGTSLWPVNLIYHHTTELPSPTAQTACYSQTMKPNSKRHLTATSVPSTTSMLILLCLIIWVMIYSRYIVQYISQNYAIKNPQPLGSVVV